MIDGKQSSSAAGESAGRPVRSSLDLARICGVSQGTVDRALHNRGRISETTRQKVLKAAQKFGYMPNPVAREMLTRSSVLVGAVALGATSVFFTDIVESLRLELLRSGLSLVVAPVGSVGEAAGMAREFAARRFHGLVFIPGDEQYIIDKLLRNSIRMIALVNPLPDREIDCIAPDETRTGADAVDYLAAKGHRRILHLSYPRRSWAVKAREKGYKGAMHTRRLSPRISLGPDQTAFEEAVKTYRPTALFCHNDWLALSAIRWLGQKGIRVPQDISVMGVDDSPTFNALYPGLTTMHYPFEDIARRASLFLTDRPSDTVAQPCAVVERETVSAPV